MEKEVDKIIIFNPSQYYLWRGNEPISHCIDYWFSRPKKPQNPPISVARSCNYCGDKFVPYICEFCEKIQEVYCSECHNEKEHDVLAHDTGKNLCGNLHGYKEDDAEYFPYY